MKHTHIWKLSEMYNQSVFGSQTILLIFKCKGCSELKPRLVEPV